MPRLKALRERDAAVTRQELLTAVGEILKEQGFHGLRTGNIARKIGRDKNLVRYHFQSLEGLEAAYIQEKDYWPPFFQRFALGQGSGREDVARMFSELLQENFRFFSGNPEMQEIILWQISEDNALLRAISERREKEGAGLLGLTDPFFEGSDISFRAVVALLLGGIYYAVLHAKYNKSTVSGIDINRPQDRKALLKTIGQVLDWAWMAAGEKAGQ